ncbi:F-box protein At2g26850 isoform X2 [Hevea brasiliensis]|uniref:F-box protein At2g26850 isoform X2 n=1 Tax=Hevea brasiliensis TaxID=3981 RepID=UPI0025E42E6C|nr:F-box protein At2g26850 isoform X2 [Hevea brasiliensis]
MLLYFLITCFSFIFLRSLPLKTLPSWASEKMNLTSNGKLENPVDDTGGMSILDLPELALDCILERLTTAGLCTMACVCTSLRERCISDHLWERRIKQKWGRIIGRAAYREWQFQIASSKDFGSCEQGKQKGLMKLLSTVWPISLMKSKDDNNNNNNNNFKHSNSSRVNSILSWYLAVETGRFWFPAQVYNRENGHVGFMLSCYDAELSYDPQTDTFRARYPPHGRRAVAIETGVQWERLRAPPVDTSPHDLHISDCLNDLRPGDHIEIQWRRNKEFPYGWWYGVVGHLESCDGNENYCRCHNSNAVVLEFHQYTRGSRWRCTMINRKDHREEGNEADGFYGGIRKLNSKEEISRWKQLWPTEVLE